MEQNKCGVFLISGFLGSGKTTLLKKLLETVPEGEKAAVLMNEFGKAGVDGDVVRKNGLEIIEISSGSI
ncbi:MAG: GTP-binding protein, partial [Synergistaceae bacterium]|nr:GTP-binding protein [Synergistaceae bacterium]